MKEISRTYLPESVKYNKRDYYRVTLPTHRKNVIIGFCNANGYKVIQVNVLARILKGRDDLHNKPYKGTQWIYSSPALSPAHETELSNKIQEADKFHQDIKA